MQPAKGERVNRKRTRIWYFVRSRHLPGRCRAERVTNLLKQNLAAGRDSRRGLLLGEDCRESGADNYTDGKIHDVAAHDKCLEFGNPARRTDAER